MVRVPLLHDIGAAEPTVAGVVTEAQRERQEDDATYIAAQSNLRHLPLTSRAETLCELGRPMTEYEITTARELPKIRQQIVDHAETVKAAYKKKYGITDDAELPVGYVGRNWLFGNIT